MKHLPKTIRSCHLIPLYNTHWHLAIAITIIAITIALFCVFKQTFEFTSERRRT